MLLLLLLLPSLDAPLVACAEQAQRQLATRDAAGWVPLHDAAAYGYADVVRALTAGDGPPPGLEATVPAEEATPLALAARRCHADAVEALLALGADPFAPSVWDPSGGGWWPWSPPSVVGVCSQNGHDGSKVAAAGVLDPRAYESAARIKRAIQDAAEAARAASREL